MGMLKTARITGASSRSAWPTDQAAFEAAVAEHVGATLDASFTSRQNAKVNSSLYMTDDVGWNKDPTTGVASGEKVAGTAGESLVFGNTVYFKSDGKWWKTDADASATAGPVRVAMALGTYAPDATGQFLLRGYAELATWGWTVGAALYLSTTAGELTSTAPSGTADIVRIAAYSQDATTVYFCPDTAYAEIV
jgi:hypothetical protein